MNGHMLVEIYVSLFSSNTKTVLVTGGASHASGLID